YDVDPLATQLADDGLHARALQPYARADRIDRIVTRRHRDLGAAADLARDRLDLDDALVDLGHLELEQARDETRIRPREDQTRTLRRLLHALQHRTDRLALAEPLARVLLLPRDDRLGIARLVQHHHDLAALHLLHLARQQIPDLARVLLADLVPLALAHPLD